jgi:hypothetical protein
MESGCANDSIKQKKEIYKQVLCQESMWILGFGWIR